MSNVKVRRHDELRKEDDPRQIRLQSQLIEYVASANLPDPDKPNITKKLESFKGLYEQKVEFRWKVFIQEEIYASQEKTNDESGRDAAYRHCNLLLAMGAIENKDVFTFLPEEIAAEFFKEVSYYRSTKSGNPAGPLRSIFVKVDRTQPARSGSSDQKTKNQVKFCDRWIEICTKEGGRRERAGRGSEQQAEQDTSGSSDRAGPSGRRASPRRPAGPTSTSATAPQPTTQQNPSAGGSRRRGRRPHIDTSIMD